jgi:hypothetical protein
VPVAPPPLALVPPVVAAVPAPRYDWGEAPAVPVVQGRTQELATLTRWVCEERCRLVLVLGEGGIGKTTLAARLAHDLVAEFAVVHWRSLRHAPPVEEWLAGAIAALSAGHAVLPEGLDARLGLLLELLRTQRGLLVLDNLETVLEPGVPDVRYRAGYEGYGEVLRRLGESAHQGCLLVTSREQPLREDYASVRALRLQGLGVDEARELLGQDDLAGERAAWEVLVARYAGNPLALRVVGKTVGAVCGGSIAAFLVQAVAVFGDIRHLLVEQVTRLSGHERAVLSWLAAEPEPVGFVELVSDLGPVLGRVAVVEAVEALARRSLLMAGGGAFTLQPVLLEYASSWLGERGGAAGQGGAVAGGGQRRPVAQPGAPGHAAATRRLPRGDRSFIRGRGRGTAAMPRYRNSNTKGGWTDGQLHTTTRMSELLAEPQLRAPYRNSPAPAQPGGGARPAP